MNEQKNRNKGDKTDMSLIFAVVLKFSTFLGFSLGFIEHFAFSLINNISITI
jgi:antibiotic biosynthesis monooxygenase (ABM) superfamily enzyme